MKIFNNSLRIHAQKIPQNRNSVNLPPRKAAIQPGMRHARKGAAAATMLPTPRSGQPLAINKCPQIARIAPNGDTGYGKRPRRPRGRAI
jgi:hypothetical protein